MLVDLASISDDLDIFDKKIPILVSFRFLRTWTIWERTFQNTTIIINILQSS